MVYQYCLHLLLIISLLMIEISAAPFVHFRRGILGDLSAGTRHRSSALSCIRFFCRSTDSTDGTRIFISDRFCLPRSDGLCSSPGTRVGSVVISVRRRSKLLWRRGIRGNASAPTRHERSTNLASHKPTLWASSWHIAEITRYLSAISLGSGVEEPFRRINFCCSSTESTE